MSRARARISFEANCGILKQLGEIFWSAAVMAEMGDKILKEVDRVYSQVTDETRRKQSVAILAPTNGKQPFPNHPAMIQNYPNTTSQRL